MQREVSIVREELNESFKNLLASIVKPNIMLIGRTGSGKSSLVNAIFGVEFARTGCGVPVTAHLEKYAPEDKSVVIYDTKGLEHGCSEQFAADTRKYLTQLSARNNLQNNVHIIWYVIDMAQARFQPFEAQICKELLHDIPLIFVLNKADSADTSQITAMKEVLEGMKLENCKGVYEVISDRKNYSFSNCVLCGSTQFRFRAKTKELICEDPNCGKTTAIAKTHGFDGLISQTINQLPDLAKLAFLHAQVLITIRNLFSQRLLTLCRWCLSTKNFEWQETPL